MLVRGLDHFWVDRPIRSLEADRKMDLMSYHLAWAADLHLEFLSPEKFDLFLHSLRDVEADGLLFLRRHLDIPTASPKAYCPLNDRQAGLFCLRESRLLPR